MNTDLFIFSVAIAGAILAILIGGYAFVIYRSHFWKIRLVDDEKEAEANLQGLQKTLESRQKDKVTLDEQINEMKGKMASAEDLIRQSAQAKEFLDQEEKSLSRCKALEQNKAALAGSMAAEETKLDSIRAQHGNLLSSVAELEVKYKGLLATVGKVEESRNEVEKLKAEHAKLAPEVEKLAKELKELEPKVNEAKELVEEISRLEKDRDSLKGMVDLAKKQIEESGTPEPKVRYADLWTPMEFEPLNLNSQDQKEEPTFARMKGYIIDDLKLKFSDRTLFAFHTALKTQMISPITVLAGISGTGKSLLPKAYAEGMGMHFTSLPVQPRWDSPQDLFGFYNYLEKRYKATDLARAMVQFEQYNRQTGNWPMTDGWDHGRDDRMLLVLLDEMNLARIEYYFSDFLSKLEIRREIQDWGDPVKRIKAEIALDMGSLAENESPIRIFPSTNVLFTGTMNEDETTQTLSDKVLDRSCVLRFGKPHKAEKFAPRGEIIPTPNGLGHKNWEDWRVDATAFNSNKIDTVNAWIDTLNEAMDEVGRPFGYRVILAIQTYCANYPEFGSGDILKVAMADQVEQRIMPKLRGLDLDLHQKPLDKIAEVIGDLQDNQLYSAFVEGRKNQMIFSWQGLDRT